jgi:hypothetical protein
MTRVINLTLAVVLASSVASAGPIGDAAARAGAMLAKQTPVEPAKHSHKKGVAHGVGGIGLLAMGVFALSQGRADRCHSNPGYHCVPWGGWEDELARRGVIVLGLGGGAVILWKGVAKLRHPKVP